MAEKPIRIGPVAPLTTASTYYTVPAGTITILRSIHIANGSSTAIVSITLGIGGAALINSLYYAFPVPILGALDWSGFLVLNAGDTLQGLSTATSLVLTASGIEIPA